MKGHLEELQAYNLEYLEAQNSEEIFGGDYTSAVELKYTNKEIERLNNLINKTTSYYYKTLSQYNNQNKKMPDEAVEMFNLLEGNK